MSCKTMDATGDSVALAPPTKKHTSTLRHALVLGTLTTLGALGIDTYLPAFPVIATSLGVDEGKVQLSLVSYFVAMAVGQMIYGPMSDRIGRRLPLLIGFVLFIAASIGTALSTSIDMLITMRFFQGLGACAGMVIPRAIVRDLRSGEEAARLFALMLLVLGVSPILAPLLGSLLLAWFPWKAMFWFLAGFGALCLAMIGLFLEETNPPEKRIIEGLGASFRTYAKLLVDPRFLVPVFIGGFSQGVLFAYLAGSPFLYIKLHHVNPTVYSLLFAGNAVGLIGLAQANVYLIRKFGVPRLILISCLVQSATAIALLLAMLFHIDSVPLIALCLFFCVGAQGMLGPTTGMLSMEPYPAIAGVASALMGTIQFAFGAISGGLISAFFNGTGIPFASVLVIFALAGLALSGLIRGQSASLPRARTGSQAD